MKKQIEVAQFTKVVLHTPQLIHIVIMLSCYDKRVLTNKNNSFLLTLSKKKKESYSILSVLEEKLAHL